MPDTIKLSRLAVRNLDASLRSLDGRWEQGYGNDDKPRGMVLVPYKMPAAAKFAVVRNLLSLKSDIEAMDKTVQDIVAQNNGEAQKLVADFYREDMEIALHKIKVADLKVEENAIPNTTIAALLPILDGEI